LKSLATGFVGHLAASSDASQPAMASPQPLQPARNRQQPVTKPDDLPGPSPAKLQTAKKAFQRRTEQAGIGKKAGCRCKTATSGSPFGAFRRAKLPEWHAGTGRFAAWNEPFRRAVRAVLQRGAPKGAEMADSGKMAVLAAFCFVLSSVCITFADDKLRSAIGEQARTALAGIIIAQEENERNKTYAHK